MPDPAPFLNGFTLAELRGLHEGVLGQPLRKDTFNRRMIDQLEPQVERDGRPYAAEPRRSTRAGIHSQATIVKCSQPLSAALALPREVGLRQLG